MKKPRLLGAALGCILSVSLPTNAAQIGIGDFDGSENVTTFDGLGLPTTNPTPIIFDGNTYATSNNLLLWDDLASPDCINACIGTAGDDLGFIDITLGATSTQVGALVGLHFTWSGTVEFFSAADVLLGTIVYNNESSMQFAGWEDASGIGRFRLTDTITNATATLLDEFRFTAAVPLPATVWLFGSGLLGLIGIARRKKAA